MQDEPLTLKRTRFLVAPLLSFLIGLLVLAGAAGPAAAQGLFQPVALVNDKGVTRFEVEQRMRLLQVLGTAGDLEQQALDGLINERLQLDSAENFGIEITDEDVATGVEEFGARTNLTGQQLLDNLAGAGVDPQSFRDFVRASLAWRQVVQGLFRGKANITQTDIDRAKSQIDPAQNAQVLISEIFLPANTPENAARAEQLAPQIQQITSFEEFAEAARAVSAAQSREVGGRVSNWVPLRNLPPAIATSFRR